jgi:hypothetical protein
MAYTVLTWIQKYHSLAAKGKKVDIATLRAETSIPNGSKSNQKPTKAQPVENSAEIDLGSDISADEPNTTAAQATVAGAQPSATGAAIGPIPQALAATGNSSPHPHTIQLCSDCTTVQDEDMKNLMMSWYYAGYYTGLYEGKQQGYAAARAERKGG